MCPTLECTFQARVCGTAPATTSPLVYCRTTCCEGHCSTQGASCPVSRCSEKPSVTCGIRTYGRFYFELKRLNRIGKHEDVQLETIYWFSAADEHWLNSLFILFNDPGVGNPLPASAFHAARQSSCWLHSKYKKYLRIINSSINYVV